MRKIGRVKVSKELLEETMNLPNLHHILSIGRLDDFGNFEVIVEGPMMPEIPDDQINPPAVKVTIHNPGPPRWEKVEVSE